jgi:hypothetical protein
MRKLTVLLTILATMALAVPAHANVGRGTVIASGEGTAATGDYTLADRGVVWQCEAFSTPKGTSTGDLPAATSITECSFFVETQRIGDAPSSDGGATTASPAVAFPIRKGRYYTICVQAETLYRDNTRRQTERVCEDGYTLEFSTVDPGQESAPTQIDRSDVEGLIDGS